MSHPVDESGIISGWLMSWLTSFLWKMRKTGPTLGDLWKTPYKDRCHITHLNFLKIWNNEKLSKGPQASVRRACFKHAATPLAVAIIATILFTILEFCAHIIVFIKLATAITNPQRLIIHEVLLVAGLTLLELLRTIMHATAELANYRMGIRLRSGLVFAVFKKLMRSPPSKTMSVGKIVNICSNDGDRLFETCTHGSWVLCGPVMFLCGVVYLGLMDNGWIGLFGCLLFFIVYPIQGVIAYKLASVRKNLIEQSDQRLKLTAELLRSIKLIKMYSWEESFKKVLLEARQSEMKYIFAAVCLQAIIFVVVVFAPIFITTCTILTSVAIGKPMSTVEGLTVYAVIGVVGYSLNSTPIFLRVLVEGLQSMKRYQRIFMMKDFEDYVEVLPEKHENSIEIVNATFGWSDNECVATDRNEETIKLSSTSTTESLTDEKVICLSDISLNIKKGMVVGICGNVGSGKSSLFHAILGQLLRKSGNVKVQGETGYCSQVPWIMNSTIKENILFGADYDEKKYNKIAEACCLLPDLATFNSGDLTEVGEHGINLSGGQKQRISLARAVYRDCDVYLLDDPLSAVDSYVGKSLFENVITNLLRSKTVLLITHQLQYLPSCDISVFMENGRIAEIGTHKELMFMKGKYNKLCTTCLEEIQEEQEIEPPVDPTSFPEELFDIERYYDEILPDESRLEAGSLIKKESMLQANTTIKSYGRYITAGGKLLFIAAIFTSFIFVLLCQFNTIWMIKHLENVSSSDNITSIGPMEEPSFVTIYLSSLGIILLFGFIRSLTSTWFSTSVSKHFHNLLFERVLKGTMEFFETTPTGRILNRFQKDLDLVDSKLPFLFDFMMFLAVLIVVQVAIIAVEYPYILLVLLTLVPIQVVLFRIAAVSVRQTRRLDNITRSPWISHIVTSCSGMSTIRSYKKTKDFIYKFERLLDINSSPYFILRCIIRWVQTRTDIFSIIITACCASFMIALQEDPRLKGMAMSFALTIFGLVKYMLGDLFVFDSCLVAVDRIGEYIDMVPQEKQIAKYQAHPISSKWPTDGKIEFRNVEMRYRLNLPLALKGVSFSITGRQRVGIVGRTGSGKSSLVASLFRLVEISSGEILIDGVNISSVKLSRLRSMVNAIPQDPTMFQGTVRYNLDPFNLYSTDEIWDVLRKVHLESKINSLSDKLEAVLDGGSSLSLGEKQLICLARAILRKNKIVILDEATSSIDSETDYLLQQTMRSHFSDSTLLIIAHRLHTVLDCDKVLVMDDGLAVEFGSPEELMEDKESHFSKLIKSVNY